MKKKQNPITDYRNETFALIKEKFPVFLLGLLISSYILVFAVGKMKIGLNKDKATMTKNKSIQIDTVKTYTVQLNDDLWGIAEKMYGSGFNAIDIAKVNKLSEPYVLTENQILIIPSIQPKLPTKGEITDEAAQTKKISEYIVLQGEYLWQIAEKIYGDGNKMGLLIDANRIPYPYNVEAGQKLIVP